MACWRHRILAVIVIAGLFVLAVGFRNIPVQAFAAAGAFQNAGQDMCMGRIIDFLTPVSIDFAFLLREVPIFF